MEKKNVLQYIKEHNLSSKEILNLLDITSIEDNLQCTIEGKSIKINGIHTDYDIVFEGDFYLVTKKFSDFMYREWRGYDGFIMHKQSSFNIANENLVFEQIYNEHKPEELIRYISLIKPGDREGRPAYRKYINVGRMFGASESYVETNTTNDSKRHRIIRDQNNYIISNYHASNEETLASEMASTCSIKRPSILSYTMPVANPDQLSELADIKCPVIKISGSFVGINPLEDVRKISPKLQYQLMIEKNKNRLEAFLSLEGSLGRETRFCVCPGEGDILLAEDIDAIMEQFSKSGFFECGDVFPLEATLVAELNSIKEDVINTSVTDELDELLLQDFNYEKTMVEAYRNIRDVYGKVVELSHKETEQMKKV